MIGIGLGDEEVEVVKEVPGNTVARRRILAGAVGEMKCGEQRLSDRLLQMGSLEVRLAQ